ncbi:MAG: DUF2807 domain-containing protein [Bacteroidales bacterium]|nr:DUF2807 domain-containing protein [Bacteroidales bacterium]
MRNFILSILLAATAFTSCNAPTGEEDISMPKSGLTDTVFKEINKKYTAIDAFSCIDVVMSDSVKTLMVVANKAVQNQLKIYVKGNTLNLGLQSNVHLNDFGNIVIYVPYNAKIKEVELSGACSFTSLRPIVGNSFSLDISGASMATCYFDMPDGQLEVNLNGCSSLNATGHVRFLEADISGASNINSKEKLGQFTFTAEDAELNVSGSSNAKLHCNGTIRGDVSGASNVIYTGTPKIKLEVSGVSSINGK